MTDPRRRFLLGAIGAGLAVVGCAKAGDAKSPKNEAHDDDEDEGVTPGEDLMREHGVLNRIMLVYEESARRLDGAEPIPFEALAKAADVVKRFIEGYHEKLEEDFLFPRFEKAGKLVELTQTLRGQHEAGRTLTDRILGLSVAATASKDDDRKRLAGAMRAFTRMYRPHEAREDTVLFPALREIVSRKELDELGEQFEDKEHELFGKEGFEGVVPQVAAIEKAFGIYELAQFTPAP
jgi:hemerythrin-like domain-containing protein